MAIFNGGAEGEIYTGGNDSDTINGNGGDDALSGNGGDDIISGGAGADIVDGGDGFDTLYSSVPAGNFSLPYYGNAFVLPVLDTGTEVTRYAAVPAPTGCSRAMATMSMAAPILTFSTSAFSVH